MVVRFFFYFQSLGWRCRYNVWPRFTKNLAHMETKKYHKEFLLLAVDVDKVVTFFFKKTPPLSQFGYFYLFFFFFLKSEVKSIRVWVDPRKGFLRAYKRKFLWYRAVETVHKGSSVTMEVTYLLGKNYPTVHKGLVCLLSDIEVLKVDWSLL